MERLIATLRSEDRDMVRLVARMAPVVEGSDVTEERYFLVGETTICQAITKVYTTQRKTTYIQQIQLSKSEALELAMAIFDDVKKSDLVRVEVQVGKEAEGVPNGPVKNASQG